MFIGMKRIVIKIGSSVINLTKRRKIDIIKIREICRDVKKLIENKNQILIVSSGAIASAMVRHNLTKRPSKISVLQSLAAIGQIELMKIYQQAFAKYNIEIAQVLLTWDDFSYRKRYLNAKNTLEKLLSMGIIPIINENDPIAIEEIKLGDNDRLSALVACLIRANILIMLSDVKGIYDKDGKLVRDVYDLNKIRDFCKGTEKSCSVGGMKTKLEAAEIVTNFGIDMIVTDGRKKYPIISALNSDERTLIKGMKKLKAKKHWIAYGGKIKGKIFIDNGAKEAILKRGKSILASGIIKKLGEFDCNDLISVFDMNLNEIARGITNYSSDEIDMIKGKKSSEIVNILGKKKSDEVIHRDNLVIIKERNYGYKKSYS
jgi:glutamate 5-kinase